MVQSTWDLTIIGSPAYVMSRRLALLRNYLRAWCLDRKLFWGIKWKQLYDTLHVYASGINTLQEGMVFTQQHRSLLQDTSLAYAYWRQRIKTNYLQVGDLPSKLLFRRLRPRSQRNIIHMLQSRPDGEWISNHNDIEDMIKKHFTTLFTSSENSSSAHPCYQENIDLVLRELDLPRLTNVDTDILLQSLSREVVKHALFSLANDKSVGADGSNVEFFKTYWHKVGDCVTDAVI